MEEKPQITDSAPVNPAPEPAPTVTSIPQTSQEFLTGSQIKPKKEHHFHPIILGSLALSILALILAGNASQTVSLGLIWLPTIVGFLALVLVFIGRKVYARRATGYLITEIIIFIICVLNTVGFGILSRPFGSGLLKIDSQVSYSIDVSQGYTGRFITTNGALVLGKSKPLIPQTDSSKVGNGMLVILPAKTSDNFTRPVVEQANSVLFQNVINESDKNHNATIIASSEETSNHYLLFAWAVRPRIEDYGQTQLIGNLNDIQNHRAYNYAIYLATNTDEEIQTVLNMIRSIKSAN